MAYLISDIRLLSPDEFEFLFFDSNAWISALKNTGRLSLEQHEKPYVYFFEAVIELHSHMGTKRAKKIKHFPKIVVTSLLLSEIINAYMRRVAMVVYYNSLQVNPKDYDYKKHYRKTDDFKKQLKNLITDFVAFKDYISLQDDGFINLDPYTILPAMNPENDFNDFYYYYYLMEKNIPIITHDADFAFQDVAILTASHTLLNIV